MSKEVSHACAALAFLGVLTWAEIAVLVGANPVALLPLLFRLGLPRLQLVPRSHLGSHPLAARGHIHSKVW